MIDASNFAETEAYERKGEVPGTWATERINQPEGDIDLVVFHGCDSERRAREYAAWDNARRTVAAGRDADRLRAALEACIRAHDTGRFEPKQAAYEAAKNLLEDLDDEN